MERAARYDVGSIQSLSGNGGGRCARREMSGASNQQRHVWLFDNVLFRMTLPMVTIRGYKHMKVV
jgi:hypothetical protein